MIRALVVGVGVLLSCGMSTNSEAAMPLRSRLHRGFAFHSNGIDDLSKAKTAATKISFDCRVILSNCSCHVSAARHDHAVSFEHRPTSISFIQIVPGRYNSTLLTQG